MLSQRLVKLYALICLGIDRDASQSLFSQSTEQAEAILSFLNRTLSKPTFGDLLDAVAKPWTKLQAVINRPRSLAHLGEVDRLAEQLLERAEILTGNLEIAAYAPALHAINVAGRQRMLSQRVAKEALLRALKLPAIRPTTARRGDAKTELVQGLHYLAALPLTNADIERELEQTMAVWEQFQEAITRHETPTGQQSIADTSEALLSHFDRLTDLIERGIQSLIGLL
jgi:hypothetical protein